jgi:hypothetical protein
VEGKEIVNKDDRIEGMSMSSSLTWGGGGVTAYLKMAQTGDAIPLNWLRDGYTWSVA